MNKMGINRKFILILLAYGISAAAVLLIPFSIEYDGSLNVLGYIAGALFWTGLIAGSVGYYILHKKEKKAVEEKTDIAAKTKKTPAPLRFFSNPPAKVMDAVMMAALCGSIYCAVNLTVSTMIAAIFLTLTLMGIYAHFLLNGTIYQAIWNNKNKREKVITGERGTKIL